jgi:hypothetical protein
VLRHNQISKGTYCHRALLFKFLADAAKVPTSLVRGQYGRVYNVLYGEGGCCESAVVLCWFALDAFCSFF